MGRRHRRKRKKLRIQGFYVFLTLVALCLFLFFSVTPAGDRFQEAVLKNSTNGISIFNIANTDYRLDASQPKPSLQSEARYPNLVGGKFLWKGISFNIPVSYTKRKPIQWSVYTSCQNSDRTTQLPLERRKSKNLYFLLDGCQIDPERDGEIVEIKIVYDDNSWDRKKLRMGQDIWPYDERSFQLRIPKEKIGWEWDAVQSLNVVKVPVNPKKVPKQVILTTLGSPEEAGIVLFSVVQERSRPSLKGLFNSLVRDPLKKAFS